MIWADLRRGLLFSTYTPAVVDGLAQEKLSTGLQPLRGEESHERPAAHLEADVDALFAPVRQIIKEVDDELNAEFGDTFKRIETDQAQVRKVASGQYVKVPSRIRPVSKCIEYPTGPAVPLRGRREWIESPRPPTAPDRSARRLDKESILPMGFRTPRSAKPSTAPAKMGSEFGLTGTEPGLSDAVEQSCPSCGNVYMPDAVYCRKCGAPRGAVPGSAPVSEPRRPFTTPREGHAGRMAAKSPRSRLPMALHVRSEFDMLRDAAEAPEGKPETAQGEEEREPSPGREAWPLTEADARGRTTEQHLGLFDPSVLERTTYQSVNSCSRKTPRSLLRVIERQRDLIAQGLQAPPPISPFCTTPRTLEANSTKIRVDAPKEATSARQDTPRGTCPPMPAMAPPGGPATRPSKKGPASAADSIPKRGNRDRNAFRSERSNAGEATSQHLQPGERSRTGPSRSKANIKFPKEVRGEAQVEQPLSMEQTIRNLVCDGKGRDKLPADKQTSFLTDNIPSMCRDLTNHEKERIASVFRDVARESNPDGNLMALNKASIAWGEVAKKFRGRLSNTHITRLGIYLNFTKRVRLNGFIERVGIFMAANPDARAKVCFAMLDSDGDAQIGERDVFAALSSSRSALSASRDSAGALEANFIEPGTIGIDFGEAETSKFEVLGIGQASQAKQLGVLPGDQLMEVNGIRVDLMTNEEVRWHLCDPARPLRLQFRRGPLIAGNLFERLLVAIKDHERFYLKIVIVSARGLRNADGGIGKSDPYCSCEVVNKPHTKCQTKVANDNLDPVWNEQLTIVDYTQGDVLRFTVYDKDFGSKQDESLGTVALTKKQLTAQGFDGELNLMDGGKTCGASLKVKVALLGGAGIPWSEFQEMFNHQELNFFVPMTETLTSMTPASLTAVATEAKPQGMRLRIIVFCAKGLRNADVGKSGDKSDPYCRCEIIGKPHTRTQTRTINDTCDPQWNEKREVRDYHEGDVLKLTVFDKDAVKDDVLGQVTFPSEKIYPRGFEGEVPLVDVGRGAVNHLHPTIKVRVVVLGAPVDPEPEEKPATRADIEKNPALHAKDVEELHRRQWLSKRDVAWYSATFEALCDQDLRIRRANMVKGAQKIFGLPCGLLAARFFELFDADDKNLVNILSWTQVIERLRTGNWSQRVTLAFQLYDLDGDGVIAVEDAMNLVREEERLVEGFAREEAFKEKIKEGHVPAQRKHSEDRHDSEENLPELCEEMKWLYNFVADGSNDVAHTNRILDVWLFQQVRPRPVVVDVLLRQLQLLIDEGTSETAIAAREG